VVPLLGPEHPRQGLAHDVPRVVPQAGGDHGGVELVRVTLAPREGPVKGLPQRLGGPVAISQAKSQDHALAGGHLEPVVGRRLRPLLGRVHRLLPPVDHVLVKGVFHERLGVERAVEALEVRVVFREEQVRASLQEEMVGPPQPGMFHPDEGRPVRPPPRAQPGAEGPAVPGPGVPAPEGRQEVQGRRIGAAVGHGEADQDIVHVRLGVLGEDVEVPVALEGAGVQQLEL